MQEQSLTIGDILRHGATWNADCRVWTRRPDGSTDVHTYGEVAGLAGQLANALAAMGIVPGDRVGTYMWNQTEHLVSYLAVPAMGAVLHTANIRLSAEQNVFTINAAGDRVLLVDASFLPDIAAQLPELPLVEAVVVNGEADLDLVTSAGRKAYQLHDLLRSYPEEYDWPDVEETSAASICFTTGTTGDPKGVAYSHRSTWLHSLSVCTMNALRIGSDDRLIIVVPMFHASGWGYPYAAFWSGAEMVLPYRFVDPESLVQMVEEHRVTFANGVPTIWKDVLRYLDHHPEHDLSSLQRIVVGGAAAHASMITEYEDRYGIDLLQGWGMTESSPLATTARPPRGATGEERLSYRASQGKVLPGVGLRVVDPDSGEPLPHDGQTVGEIELRGNWIAGSYLNVTQPEKFSGGWLRTGDVGTVDRRGYVRLTDRAKDVIKSGGEWISSVALEEQICLHPAVADAAVIGVADERWDERPCALVVAKETPPGADEMRDWLAGRVQRWWLPERWGFLAELPRTSVGKIDKKLLRSRYEDGQLQVVTLPPPKRGVA